MVSKSEFKEEVNRIAENIKVKPRQIRVRSMKSRIGSCSPHKTITFSTSVLGLTESLRKEAIVHELLHLRYKNHGKMFKVMLKTYFEMEESIPTSERVT